jgi:hypothetical protein
MVEGDTEWNVFFDEIIRDPVLERVLALDFPHLSRRARGEDHFRLTELPLLSFLHQKGPDTIHIVGDIPLSPNIAGVVNNKEFHMNIPWWAMIVIRAGIAIGAPALSKVIGPQIVSLIQDLLNHLLNHPDPATRMAEVQALHRDSGIGSPPDLKR